MFRPSTADETTRFREQVYRTTSLYDDIMMTSFYLQERFRYSQPFKSYTYDIRGYEAAVGPVKVRADLQHSYLAHYM